MVEVGTGTSGSKYLKTKWPITDGLIAGTTTQEGHEENLVADEILIEKEHREDVI